MTRSASTNLGRPAAGPQTPLLLDVRDVASLLDCSARHVYRLSDAGQMPPPVRLGSLVRWRRTDLDEWIQTGCPRAGRAGQ